MTGILRQQAAARGLTYGEYLRQLAECGENIDAIAERVGVTNARLYYEWNRYGMKKRKAKDFEFLGVVDSLKGHCESLDLNINIVRMRVFHSKGTKTNADVLAAMLAEQQKRELREMGVAA